MSEDSQPSTAYLVGCDDSTPVPLDGFSEAEIEAIRKLSRLSKECSEYSCMPALLVGRMVKKRTVRGDFYEAFEEEKL